MNKKYNQRIKHYNAGINHPQFVKGITKELLIKEYIKNKKSTLKISTKLKCSEETIMDRLIKYNIPRRTISEALKANKGENSGAYIHGKGYEPYTKEFNESLKEQIRERDNKQCQLCFKKQSKLKGWFKKLDVHHIDYNKQNCDEDNLITLCRQCNDEVNLNRDYWYAYFVYIMEDK